MKKILFIFIAVFFPITIYSEDAVVSVYDEFDEGLFGKSIHRGVIVSVKKAAFTRAETVEVNNEDEQGFLTAVIISRSNVEKLMSGAFDLRERIVEGQIVFSYDNEGLHFEFSVEKANKKILDIVSEYYRDDEIWHDPLVEYYRENYVIRIHSAENIFDSWNDEITYNEAMVAATLIGDSDQWLWGIHDGSDILNLGY